MKNSTTECAIRRILGALIASDLECEDLREISRALRDGTGFGGELADRLEAVVGALDPVRARITGVRKTVEVSALDELKALVDRAAMSRQDLGSFLIATSGTQGWTPGSKVSKAKLLESFVRAVGEEQAKFAATVLRQRLHIPQDAYLDRLMQRQDRG